MAQFLFLLLFFPEAASGLMVVTVHPGDDVILPCKAPDSFILVVEWTRADLKPEYVLFYIDGRLDLTQQHPSFKDRVDLVDRDLKDGHVSLILKNVNRHDAGTYECRVASGGIMDSEPIRTIRLQVAEPAGPEDRNSSPVGLIVELAAGVLVLVAAAVFGVQMYKRHKDNRSGHGVVMYKRHKNKRSGQPAADEASADLIKVTVHPGDDVTLPCQANGSSISVVEWTRPDLEPEYVVLYSDGHLETDHQHPSFKDRVELVDRELKDGDVSLILKNVSSIDTGTYKCRVKTDDTDQIRTISTIRLQVPDPAGPEDRNSSPGGRYGGLAAGDDEASADKFI